MAPASISHIGRSILLFVAVAAPVAAHADSMNAALSFVEVADEVAQTSRVHRQARNLDLGVINRSRVSDWSARRLGRPNERVQDVKGIIGMPTRIGKAFLLWRLDGSDTLVRETNYTSFVETITINFHPGGCDATVDYRLKLGYPQFGMWNLVTGAPMPISRIRAEDIRCKLGSAAVS